MADEHLQPQRGWALIRDNSEPSLSEIEHLTSCASCNEWLTKFFSLAREAGFKITFKIPPGPPKKNGGHGSTHQGSEVA